MLNGVIKEIRKDGYWCIKTDATKEKAHLKTLWIGARYHTTAPYAKVGDKVICSYHRVYNGAVWFAQIKEESNESIDGNSFSA